MDTSDAIHLAINAMIRDYKKYRVVRDVPYIELESKPIEEVNNEV